MYPLGMNICTLSWKYMRAYSMTPARAFVEKTDRPVVGQMSVSTHFAMQVQFFHACKNTNEVSGSLP